jgi:serine/threonine protein kinase
MRAVAAVPHIHLASVYAAAAVSDGAYSVTEWTGGVTMQDRLDAGEPMTPTEFITNAAGVAGALAALHASTVLHGAIDPSAIRFSSAHPAKLGAFGRVPVATSSNRSSRRRRSCCGSPGSTECRRTDHKKRLELAMAGPCVRPAPRRRRTHRLRHAPRIRI